MTELRRHLFTSEDNFFLVFIGAWIAINQDIWKTEIDLLISMVAHVLLIGIIVGIMRMNYIEGKNNYISKTGFAIIIIICVISLISIFFTISCVSITREISGDEMSFNFNFDSIKESIQWVVILGVIEGAWIIMQFSFYISSKFKGEEQVKEGK